MTTTRALPGHALKCSAMRRPEREHTWSGNDVVKINKTELHKEKLIIVLGNLTRNPEMWIYKTLTHDWVVLSSVRPSQTPEGKHYFLELLLASSFSKSTRWVSFSAFEQTKKSKFQVAEFTCPWAKSWSQRAPQMEGGKPTLLQTAWAGQGGKYSSMCFLI